MTVSKSRYSKLVFHATLASALCLSVAHSEDYSWDLAGDGNWSEAANWDPTGGPPDAAGDGAFFNTGTAHVDNPLRTITLDGDFQTGELRFGFINDVSAWGNVRMLDGGGGSTLTVDNGGEGAKVYVGSNNINFSSFGDLFLADGVTLNTVGGGAYIAAIDPVYRSSNSQPTLTGQVTLETGSTLNLGTPAAPSQLQVGVANNSGSTQQGVNGSLTADAGSVVNIYATDIIIGSQANQRPNPPANGRFGTVDLQNADVQNFETEANLIIGRNTRLYQFGSDTVTGTGSQGSLALANMQGHVGGDLWVGDFYVDIEPGLGSSGLLTLDNAILKVDGNLEIYETGVIEVTLNGAPSGLELASGSVLELRPDDGYTMVFNDLDGYTGIYYGLAWEGDNVTALETLVTDGKISWVNNADGFVDIFYDSNSDFSYIAVIPEPHTIFFLLLPLAWLLVRNRRR